MHYAQEDDREQMTRDEEHWQRYYFGRSAAEIMQGIATGTRDPVQASQLRKNLAIELTYQIALKYGVRLDSTNKQCQDLLREAADALGSGNWHVSGLKLLKWDQIPKFRGLLRSCLYHATLFRVPVVVAARFLLPILVMTEILDAKRGSSEITTILGDLNYLAFVKTSIMVAIGGCKDPYFVVYHSEGTGYPAWVPSGLVRPENGPQPTPGCGNPDFSHTTWITEADVESYCPGSSIHMEDSEFEDAIDRIPSAAAEPLHPPSSNETRSNDLDTAARGDSSNRGNVMQRVIEDLVRLSESFRQKIDSKENQWTGDGIFYQGGGRLDNISHLILGAVEVPRHPFFMNIYRESPSIYSRSKAIGCWTGQIEPLLDGTGGHTTDEDIEELLDLVTEPLIVVLDEPRRKRLMAWIDKNTGTGSSSLRDELLELRERVRAELTTNTEQYQLYEPVDVPTYGSERPLLWLMQAIDDLTTKGKEMLEMQADNTAWEQLGHHLTTTPHRMVWVLHILLSAYQATHQEEQQNLHERVRDLESLLAEAQGDATYWKEKYEKSILICKSEVWANRMESIKQNGDAIAEERKVNKP
jgi:hypothetical protein